MVEILRHPGAYPHPVDEVEVCQTHISWVFLAGDRAYKVKRPVVFPFLDFSTLERRRHFCEEEVRLNRRLAPGVYRGVVPVTTSGLGEGAVIDYAVEMERLPRDGMLDRRLRDGVAVPLQEIADRIADFHAATDIVPVDMRRKIADTLERARPYLPPGWTERLADSDRKIDTSLLERRLADGRSRDGHGDLHAGNICVRGGEIVIYDCIEFAAEFRCGDVAADLAFLTMDLKFHGAWDGARLVTERYVARSGDEEIPLLLPYYERHRALVRGFVNAVQGHESARRYLRLAMPVGGFQVLLCGLPGTGKSTLARRIADQFGATVLRSDQVRKELYGMSPSDHWEGGYTEGLYAPDMTRRTYTALRERARGQKRVVLDATFQKQWQRDLFPDALVVYLQLPEEVVRARLAQRAKDDQAISDADYAIYLEARARFEPPAAPDLSGDDDAVLDGILHRACGIPRAPRPPGS